MKVAILADIHANLPAWTAVEAELGLMQIDATVIAGDIVGYYYWPSEVIERLVRRPNLYVVRGNHEDMLEEFRNDLWSRARLRKKYGHGLDVALDTLTAQQFAWLENLPNEAVVDIGGRRLVIRHSANTQNEGYLYPDAPSEAFPPAMAENADLTIYAHTHHPFVWVSPGGGAILNPGSVGQPRDIGGLASFVVFETTSCSARFVRTEFDTHTLKTAVQTYDPNLASVSKSLDWKRL